MKTTLEVMQRQIENKARLTLIQRLKEEVVNQTFEAMEEENDATNPIDVWTVYSVTLGKEDGVRCINFPIFYVNASDEFPLPCGDGKEEKEAAKACGYIIIDWLLLDTVGNILKS